jgi:periplasmic mercuric ion binding protein
MKKLGFLIVAIVALFTHQTVLAQATKTETFKVFGNCSMCEKRIEKAAAAEGVTKADWNVDTKIMTVTYDPSKITNAAIQKKIANVGHDTDKEKAADSVYDKLPGCCHYDRNGGNSSTHHH